MTSWLAHYGVAAIFILMLIDAVFPAASELVMVYAGALASGALTHRVDVLGWHGTGFSAYVAVVLAGVVGYQLGAIGGWWIGDRGGRGFLERAERGAGKWRGGPWPARARGAHCCPHTGVFARGGRADGCPGRVLDP